MSVDIGPLHKSDRDAVARLFAHYPYKSYQKDVQGIDAERLATLLWDLTEPLLEKPDTQAIVARRSGAQEAIGLGLVAGHPWHSEVFGRPMGRIEHLVNYVDPPGVGPVLIAALLDAASKAGMNHLACRVDGSDWSNLQQLESFGFRCVDCSLKMARRLDGYREAAEPGQPTKIAIRPFEGSDLEAIQEIAVRSHVHNHFYNDPVLGRDRAELLFREWIRRCTERLAHFVLVAEDSDSRRVGFATVLRNAALARVVGLRIGIIDYIVVDRDVAGRGIGRALLDAALRRLATDHDWAELRTSHDNYGAVGFYGSAGFRIVASDFVLHRWEEEALGAREWINERMC